MAIESALDRAIPREKAPPGTRRKRVVKGVADLLGVDLPVKVVIREVPAKIDYTNNSFFRIDTVFSVLEQTEDVVKTRNALRLIQSEIQRPIDSRIDGKPVNPITRGTTLGLFQGSPDAVDEIIELMRRNRITSGKRSKEDENGIASIETTLVGIKLRLLILQADKEENLPSIGRLFLDFDDTALEALKKSPMLPDLLALKSLKK